MTSITKKTCTIEGCNRPASSRGWCTTHYSRWRRSGDVSKGRSSGGICSIEGCSERIEARGLCRRHYEYQQYQLNPAPRIVNLAGEVWRPVIGYEGTYEVSSAGRVKRLAGLIYPRGRRADANPRRKTERLLVVKPNNRGYHQVTLCVNGTERKALIHRLATIAFLGNAGIGWMVNHKDFDRTNNDINNLEWVTSAGNNRHMRLAGRANPRRGEDHPKAKLTAAMVREIRSLYPDVRAADLARQYGVTAQNIAAVVKGVTWRHI